MTENMAQDQADAYFETLADIWATIDGERMVKCDECGGFGDECDECDGTGEVAATEYEGQDPREFLDQLPLEIVWEVGEPFAVVLGTGGPHTEITGGGRASGAGYELWSYWGGDKGVRRGGPVARTGEYFRELVEETGA